MLFIIPPLSPDLYLDPGSGSIIFQMIIALFLGAGIIVRAQWSRIKRWLGGKSDNVDESEDDEKKDEN